MAPDPTPAGLAVVLASLADDRARLSLLTDAAMRRIEALDLRWERSAERLIEAYESLLAPADDESSDGSGVAATD
jgi:glycosyltransferase involved in cell wall biosynthesis